MTDSLDEKREWYEREVCVDRVSYKSLPWAFMICGQSPLKVIVGKWDTAAVVSSILNEDYLSRKCIKKTFKISFYLVRNTCQVEISRETRMKQKPEKNEINNKWKGQKHDG